MKTTFIAALPLIGAALGAPVRRSEYDIKITLINDFTGGSATHGVPSGDFDNSISAIWGQDANLNVDGAVKASSVLLNDVTKDGKRVDCTIKLGGDSYALTSEKTWVDLDGVAGPGLFDLSAATLSCVVAGEEPISAKERRSEFDINITLFNDQSGASDVRGVPSGDFQNSIKAIFQGSKLDVGDGQILATSAQLATLNIPGNRRVDCTFTVGAETITINSLSTWADLDGRPGAELYDLTEGTVACIVEGEQRV